MFFTSQAVGNMRLAASRRASVDELAEIAPDLLRRLWAKGEEEMWGAAGGRIFLVG